MQCKIIQTEIGTLDYSITLLVLCISSKYLMNYSHDHASQYYLLIAIVSIHLSMYVWISLKSP